MRHVPCEYLDVLDDAAFGAATTVEPKFTSYSDPSSQWTAARKGPAFFAYSTNYLIDTDTAVIVDVEATRSIRQAEVGSVRTMLDRVKDRFDLHPECMIADTAYGSGPMPGRLVDCKIAPHILVIDKTGRNDETWAGTAPVTRPEPCERRISTRCNRPKPPQTCQDASCTAENAKDLTRRALELHPRPNLLRSQYGVFPHSRR